MSAPLLEVRDLSVAFDGDAGPVAAVSAVSFTVARGETLVIVGESGSGKSVTSLAVMGLIPRPPGRIAGGAILFHGRDGAITDLACASPAAMQRIRGAEIAMIFQEPMTALNPVYTVGRQIVETLQLHEPLGRRAARRRAIDMLGWLGVPDPARRVDAYPHELSGGLRQRATIAMALSCRPSLLIADEPTTALDVTVQAQILDLIGRLQRELAMGVIFITHNLGVAAAIADRVLVMYAGQVVEAAPTRALFERTRMPYTRGLLDSIPRLGMDRDAGPLPTIPGTVPRAGARPAGCAFHPRCAHAMPYPCMDRTPDLETAEGGHAVRCARWRELTPA